jgi:ribosome biogenesis protein ENP2
LAAREEANERRKALRLLRKRGEAAEEEEKIQGDVEAVVTMKPTKKSTTDLIEDDRFKRLFEDEDFEIDEMSREFQMHNPSSAVDRSNGELKKRGLTAVEAEDLDETRGSSDEGSSNDDEDEQAEAAALRARQRRPPRDQNEEGSKGRIGNASYKKSGHQSRQQREEPKMPRMQVSSSNKSAIDKQRARQARSFGDLASGLASRGGSGGGGRKGDVVGEKEVTFAPSKPVKKQHRAVEDGGGGREAPRGKERKERRSASGNTFRRM